MTAVAPVPLTWVAIAAAVVCSAPPRMRGRAAALAAAGRLSRRNPTRRKRGLGRVSGPLAGAGCAVAVVGVGRVFGVALAVAAAAVLGAVLSAASARRRRRTAEAARRDISAAVRTLVAELEAGSRPADALAGAGQAGRLVSAPFVAASRAAEAGGDAAEVLQTCATAEIRAVGVAWRLGEAAGAAPAAVLARVAADLAAAEEQRRIAAVALAGPRSSAALLTGLPVLGVVLGAAMGARPLSFLLEVPAGRALCCAGVLLDLAGVVWMRRILDRAESP